MNEVIFANSLGALPSIQLSCRRYHLSAKTPLNRINDALAALPAVYSWGRLEGLVIRGSQLKSLIKSLG